MGRILVPQRVNPDVYENGGLLLHPAHSLTSNVSMTMPFSVIICASMNSAAAAAACKNVAFDVASYRWPASLDIMMI